VYGFHVENTLTTLPNDFNTQAGAQEVFGNGMIFNVYPAFFDTLANNFRLLPCSPAVNAGSNFVADTFGLVTDLDGQARIFGDMVDMGAYETQDSCMTSATQEAIAVYFKARLSPNPVPTNSNYHLQVTGSGFSMLRWELWDSYGRQIAHDQQVLVDEALLSLPSPASPGIYFLQVQSGSQAIWLKMVVQE